MRHGTLLIDKAAGMTSHDVVCRVRSILHERHIGHIGTLDPSATGLLVLFVGKKALKTVELFDNLEKEYEARIVFGKTSTTYDGDGIIENIPAKKGWKPPTEKQLLDVLNTRFTGMITQMPPAYSAVHVHGRRAYEIIRNDPDAVLDLDERRVVIKKMQLVSYDYPNCMLRMTCGSGTYVRSIANDLGKFLRCGGYLSGLRRTRIGAWKISGAHKIASSPKSGNHQDAEANNGQNDILQVSWRDVVPIKDALSDFPRCDVDKTQFADLKHGRSIVANIPKGLTIAWYDGLPIAILEIKGGKAHPRKVLQ